MSSEGTPTYWAVLVGINHYRNGKGRDLRGAVQDIEDVEKMLEDHLKDKTREIIKITARAPDDQVQTPTETKPQGLPDYETVVAQALERVRDRAKAGDFFYFHFSGHGGRQLRNNDPEIKTGGARYEVLVLDGDRNLRDFELGSLLDSVAKRGVTTFAVLDCCHSGGADRADDIVRGIDEILPAGPEDDLGVDAPPSPDQTDEGRDESANVAATYRDADTQMSFWLRARNYTLLAACHPAEKARETFDRNRHRGALTSAILQAMGQLAATGKLPTYRALYEATGAIMLKEGHTQRCMLHGKRDLFLFGNQSLESTRAGTVRNVEKDILIDIGEVHGVVEGEEYEVYPPGETIESGSTNKLPKIKVTKVEACQSYAQLSAENDPIEVGSIVKLVTPVIRDPLHVKVHDEELFRQLTKLGNEEPSPFNPTIHPPGDNAGAAFQVVSRESHYQITDSIGTALQYSLPIPADPGAEAARTVFTCLRRLARYNFVLGLINKNSKLKDSFAFSVTPLEVVHDGKVTIEFKNLTNSTKARDLYFTLFNLTPRRAAIVACENTCVAHGEAYTDDVSMIIPDEMHVDEIEDILKVVVTTEASHFGVLETPGLHELDMAGRCDDEYGEAEDLEGILDSLNEGCRELGKTKISSWDTHQVIVKTKRG
jgi:hypothetical protein